MRLIALYGLFAVALGPCERRNTAVCDKTDFPDCESGYYCDIGPTESAGRCVPNECSTTSNTCPAEKPFCSEGRCVSPCSTDAQCMARSTDAPLCISGTCAGCRESADCTNATRPICETASHTCRPCTLHSDCASGVCVKDSVFASLPKPLPQGMCAPSDRVLVVDEKTCTGVDCQIQAQVNLASVEKPFVLLKNTGGVKFISVTAPPSGLPEVRIIGPIADRGPASLATLPTGTAITLQNGSGSGSGLRAQVGASVAIEGVIAANSSMYNVECDSTNRGMSTAATTKVRIIRSLIGGSAFGINATARCEVSVDQSWIGPGGGPLSMVVTGKNDRAMKLDSTKLEVTNSVLWRNGSGSAFGRIELTDSLGIKPAGRIVHTTFVSQDFGMVLAIECSTNAGLSIVNNLFLNESAPAMNISYVNSKCYAGGVFVGNAWNDANSTVMNTFKDVVYTDLVSPATGNLRLKETAPVSVRNQAVTSASDAQGTIPLPLVDLDGLGRGGTSRSVGAFEGMH